MNLDTGGLMPIYDAAKRIGAEEIAAAHEYSPDELSDFELFSLMDDLGFVYDESSKSWIPNE
jgi:hypothetical protein